jgi:hypothetical protein
MKYWKVEKDMTNAQYAKTELQQHIKFGIDYCKLEEDFKFGTYYLKISMKS